MSSIFLGLASLDLVFDMDEIPVEDKKGRARRLFVCAGGPAGNAAATYAILGGDAVLVTSIGNTHFGREIREEYEALGIRVIDCCKNDEDFPCIAGIAINPCRGTRTIWGSPAPAQANVSDDMILSLLNGTRFVFADGYIADIALNFLRLARAKDVATVIDAGSWKPDFDRFIRLGNEVIASADCIPPKEFGGEFLEAALSLGVNGAAVTNGPNAIMWRTRANDRKGQLMPPIVAAVDSLGAGDIFHGAYCYYRYDMHMGFEDAMKFASIVAAESVKYYGPREGVRRMAHV